MARRKFHYTGALGSATTAESVAADVRGLDYVSISAYSRDGGTWNASLRIAVEVSLNGADWYAATYVDAAAGVPTAAVIFDSNSIKRLIPVYDVKYLRVRVSATGGTTTIEINIYGEGEADPAERSLTTGDRTGVAAVGFGSSATPDGGYSGSSGGIPS